MAQRDLTDKQFLAALKRNHFSRPVLFWCSDLDNPNFSYGIICDAKGKIYKRQTISYLLERRRAAAKQPIKQAESPNA